VVIVAGVGLPREQVLALASMLWRDDSTRTARLLLEALTKRQQFVALTLDDRERILAVLDHPPEGLTELRTRLFDELNWQRRGLEPPVRSRRGAQPPNVAWV
jgi:hypothetical protein